MHGDSCSELNDSRIINQEISGRFQILKIICGIKWDWEEQFVLMDFHCLN